MAAKRKDTFDASFGLANHALRVQELGKALLVQAARALGCSDLNDFSTANPQLLDPDSLGSAQKVFSAVSAQLSSVAKLYDQISNQHRDQIRETILIDVLRETSPELAERFLGLYEEKLAGSELGTASE
jgi:hypothetical protein